MRFRTILVLLLILLAIVGASSYIYNSLRRSSQPPLPPPPVSLVDAPFRVYGLVEPFEREVFVGPLLARRVVAIYVREGERVAQDQPLCRQDDDIEQQALRLATSRLEETSRRLDLTRDDLRRKESLLQKKAIPEFDYSQVRLQARLEEQQIASARAEVELRRVELAKLTLRAPMAGKIYKFDVRLGEQLTPEDYRRIVIGRREQQVRLFVEAFWFNRLRPGDRFTVKTVEGLQEVGTGEVIEIAPYMGQRDFRTEDSRERLDTKFLQVILRLDTTTPLPLGLQVVAERPPSP